MADNQPKSIFDNIKSVFGNIAAGNVSAVKGAILIPYKETVPATPSQIAAEQSKQNNKSILKNLFGF